MDVAVKKPAVTAAMQAVIEARVEAILQAHANNLIENMDMGADVLEAMLDLAREPVSNEEFTRREKAIWLEECRQMAKQHPQHALEFKCPAETV